MNKKLLILLALALTSAMPALAANEGPRGAPRPIDFEDALLERSVGAGGLLPPWVKPVSSECKVYSDRVEVTTREGDEVSTVNNSIVFDEQVNNLAKLNELIEEAAQGKIRTTPAPTDVPRFKDIARRSDVGTHKEVILQARQRDDQYNQSEAAKTLIRFLNINCAANRVIAEFKRNPGFVPAPMRFVSGVRVLSDGSVIYFKNDEIKALAKLSEEALAALNAKISAVPADAELVDQEPGAPLCTDAPSSNYSVTQDGVRKVIAREASCHEYQAVSAFGIKALLDGFFAIAQ